MRITALVMVVGLSLLGLALHYDWAEPVADASPIQRVVGSWGSAWERVCDAEQRLLDPDGDAAYARDVLVELASRADAIGDRARLALPAAMLRVGDAAGAREHLSGLRLVLRPRPWSEACAIMGQAMLVQAYARREKTDALLAVAETIAAWDPRFESFAESLRQPGLVHLPWMEEPDCLPWRGGIICYSGMD